MSTNFLDIDIIQSNVNEIHIKSLKLYEFFSSLTVRQLHLRLYSYFHRSTQENFTKCAPIKEKFPKYILIKLTIKISQVEKIQKYPW